MTPRLSIFLLSLVQSAFGVIGPLPAPAVPAGLQVELRTVANRTTFQMSELVPLEISFGATRPSTYSIELADGWNPAATDHFLVEPADSVIDRQRWLHGIICCDSRRAFLESTPAVYAHELTDVLRFTEPGEYRIQYSTRRVFAAPPIRAFDPSDLLIRSNVLTIRITADDPKWLNDALPRVLAHVKLRPASESPALPKLPPRGSLTLPIISDAAVRYRQAGRQLRLLDTPDAIRARVARIQMPSVDAWRTLEAAGNGYSGVDDSVAHSSRPDLVAAALRERAAAPDFAIMRGYFELWVRVLMERDHPALGRLRPLDGNPNLEANREVDANVRAQLLEIVRDLNRTKAALAAEITSATLRHVERDLRR